MIRIASNNDIPRIAEIELFVSRYSFKSIFSNEFLYKKLTYEYHKNWIEKQIINMEKYSGIKFYVLEEENIIIAYFSIGFSDNNEECELFNIRIDVPFQHNKNGTIIINYCFELVKNNGTKLITVRAFENNTVARRFYEKFGFKINDRYFSEEFGIFFLKYIKHF